MSEAWHTAAKLITSEASNLNSFIAHVLVKYLLHSCRKPERLVESTLLCCVTQEIGAENTLLLSPFASTSPPCAFKMQKTILPQGLKSK